MAKYVYFFGDGRAEGNGKMKDLLGGKGAGLAEMTNSRVPVPPGFTIITKVCNYSYKNKGRLPSGLEEEMKKNIQRLERAMGKRFGDSVNPLLVSVRSGAKFSMPGMMDTVLNLGLNDKTIKGLMGKTNDERFAWDAYRRLIQMFGNVVMGIEKSKFERLLDKKKREKGIKFDHQLQVDNLKDLVVRFKGVYKKETGKDFPSDSLRQLKMAIDSVFKSWNNPRAVTYRRLNKIPDDLGTAVNVQVMVFGNMGNDSGTGVGFTRDPA
ncbi:MAG: pyruvate, phosphate dikinase, partial [Candidatus Omnitrophica bacterium]|nr:pyruvate, phosphate dikinase [Candidatus Omnitrophota bacterium]